MTAFRAGASFAENGKVQVDGNASVVDKVPPTVRMLLDKETPARAMAGEDVQLSYAVEWIEAQAEEANAELTRQAAAGWAVTLAALMGLAIWFGRG